MRDKLILLISFSFFLHVFMVTVWPSSQDKPRDRAVRGSISLSTHPYKSHTVISLKGGTAQPSGNSPASDAFGNLCLF